MSASLPARLVLDVAARAGTVRELVASAGERAYAAGGGEYAVALVSLGDVRLADAPEAGLVARARVTLDLLGSVTPDVPTRPVMDDPVPPVPTDPRGGRTP